MHNAQTKQGIELLMYLMIKYYRHNPQTAVSHGPNESPWRGTVQKQGHIWYENTESSWCLAVASLAEQDEVGFSTRPCFHVGTYIFQRKSMPFTFQAERNVNLEGTQGWYWVVTGEGGRQVLLKIFSFEVFLHWWIYHEDRSVEW